MLFQYVWFMQFEKKCQTPGNIGTVRRVLFERYHSDTSVLAGLTDNYIPVYCHMKQEEAESLINRFGDVKLEKLYQDGMSGKIAGNIR